ncbi:MAG: hypothetical protein RL205_1227 [Actinomycetota bacterium]
MACLFTALLTFCIPASAASSPSIAASVNVGTNPNSVAIANDSTKAVVTNYASNTISIIDIATGTATSVGVGTHPTAVAITPDGTTALVTNYGSSTVSFVSLVSETVTSTITLAAGAQPGSVVISHDGSTAFVADGGLGINLIERIDISSRTITGSVTATLPGGLLMSPDGQTVYATAAMSGQVSYFNTTTLSRGTITLSDYYGTPATSLAISPDGATLYVVRGTQYHIVSMLNTVTHSQTSTTVVGSYPRGAAVSPDGSRVYVTNSGSDTVSVLNSAGAITGTIPVGQTPDQVSFTPDGLLALVTNQAGNSVFFIDPSSATVVSTLAVGATPTKLAINTLGTKALVINYASNSVSIINLPYSEIVGGPTAAIQQYGIQETDRCGVAPPDSVLMPAFGEEWRNFGWGHSWAQWPADGRGGYVCTRQPLYTTNGWLIAS